MPWTLLQYTDPSTRSVIHDDLATELVDEVWVSEGIRLAVSLDAELVETPRYRWDTWDEAPPYVEREKPMLQMYSDAINLLPGFVDEQ